MSMEFDLVPPGMLVESGGDGKAVDISGSATRTFLCQMEITDQIEQESLDVSIWGSADGENWGQKPLLKLPQRFYRSETRMVFDLTARSEVKFIRAHWDVGRWGRVAPNPRFVFRLHLTEVAAFPKPAPATKVPASS